MGQIRPDENKLPRQKRADMITDHGTASALGNQMELIFRVVIPAGDGCRVIVPVPAETVGLLLRYQSQNGRVQPPSSILTRGGAIRGDAIEKRHETCLVRAESQNVIWSLTSSGRPSAARSKAAIPSLNGKLPEISGLRSILPEAMSAMARS